MNKRRTLGKWCSRLALLPVLRVAERQRPALKILAYHRVMDVDEARYPFDLELVDATPQQFNEQVAYLKKHYRLLTLADAMAAVRSGERVDDIVVLTFDDGFDDLYHTIFPILQAHQVTATIFLTTGLIGSQRTLWSEELNYAFKTRLGRRLTLPEVFTAPVELDNANWQQHLGQLLKALKLLPDEARKAAMQRVFDQLDIVSPVQSPLSQMLTWDMVREMAADGIEFGAHSVSHSVLTKLNGDQLINELHASKQQIERELQQSCPSMAYPVGGEASFNQTVIDHCKAAGYEQVCSYLSGVNYLDSLQPFALRRIHVDRSVDFDWFRAEVAFPALCAADFLRE